MLRTASAIEMLVTTSVQKAKRRNADEEVASTSEENGESLNGGTHRTARGEQPAGAAY